MKEFIKLSIMLIIAACSTLNRREMVKLDPAAPSDQVVSSCNQKNFGDAFKIKMKDGHRVAVRSVGDIDYGFFGPVIFSVIPARLPFTSTQSLGLTIQFEQNSSVAQAPKEFELRNIYIMMNGQKFTPQAFYDHVGGKELQDTLLKPALQKEAYVLFSLPKMKAATSLELNLNDDIRVPLKAERSWRYSAVEVSDLDPDFKPCKL